MRKVPLFTVILFTIIFVISCRQKQQESFAIEGNIKNAPSAKILLMQLPFDDKQPALIIDSNSLQPNGSFHFKAIAKEEGLYRVYFENGPSWWLINDSKNIHLDADVLHYKKYSIVGSNASTALHSFFMGYDSLYLKAISTKHIYDSLKESSATDSIKKIAETNNNTVATQVAIFMRTAIKTSKSPALSFYLLKQAYHNEMVELDEAVGLSKELTTKYTSHSGIKSLHNYFTEEWNNSPKNMFMNKPAPPLHMNTIDGVPFDWNSLKGKYVLLDFWASWCKPCRIENPNVVAAYKQFRDKNFMIVGVSLDDNVQAWKNAVKEDSLSWTHISDLKQWKSEAAQAYNFNAIPFNILINSEGKVIASDLRGNDLIEKLRQVLK